MRVFNHLIGKSPLDPHEYQLNLMNSPLNHQISLWLLLVPRFSCYNILTPNYIIFLNLLKPSAKVGFMHRSQLQNRGKAGPSDGVGVPLPDSDDEKPPPPQVGDPLGTAVAPTGRQYSNAFWCQSGFSRPPLFHNRLYFWFFLHIVELPTRRGRTAGQTDKWYIGVYRPFSIAMLINPSLKYEALAMKNG